MFNVCVRVPPRSLSFISPIERHYFMCLAQHYAVVLCEKKVDGLDRNSLSLFWPTCIQLLDLMSDVGLKSWLQTPMG